MSLSNSISNTNESGASMTSIKGIWSPSTTSRHRPEMTTPVTSSMNLTTTFSEATTTIKPNENQPIIITAATVGSCLLIISVAFGLAIWLRKKKSSSKTEQRLARAVPPSNEQKSIENKNTADLSTKLSVSDGAEPQYALVELSKSGAADHERLIDTSTAETPYAEISGHWNQTQNYVHVDLKIPQQKSTKKDDSQVEYAVIDHSKLVKTVSEDSLKKEGLLTTTEDLCCTTPLNANTLHTLLTPAVGKWCDIGLAMGIDEDVLKEGIYPGNSTDWQRLGEVCGMFCKKTEQPNWEEVVRILWKVEEWEIADKICRQEKLQVKRPEETTEPPPSIPSKSSSIRKPKD